jgi:hypothetical protein
VGSHPSGVAEKPLVKLLLLWAKWLRLTGIPYLLVFFGLVRVKLACKDPSKIPKQRLFKIQKKVVCGSV